MAFLIISTPVVNGYEDVLTHEISFLFLIVIDNSYNHCPAHCLQMQQVNGKVSDAKFVL